MLAIESTMFKSLPFEDAIKLFKAWGFRVEPGPRPDEVTVIIDAPDHRTYAVYPANLFAQVAAVILRVRWQNGALSAALAERRMAKAKQADLMMPALFRTALVRQ